MNGMRKLTFNEMRGLSGGEAITLASIMAVLVVAIVAVVVYRIFMSSKGSAELPGGYEFNWGK